MRPRDIRPDAEPTSATGVDRTLIDEMLRMTPRQRLQQNDRMAALAVRLRAAFEIVRLKQRSTDAKDRLQLPVLEATLKRRQG